MTSGLELKFGYSRDLERYLMEFKQATIILPAKITSKAGI